MFETAWRVDARCHNLPVELFYPEKSEWLAPRLVCEKCPVREPCLEHALTHDETTGMWGGFTPGERSRIAHERTSGSAGAPAGGSVEQDMPTGSHNPDDKPNRGQGG